MNPPEQLRAEPKKQVIDAVEEMRAMVLSALEARSRGDFHLSGSQSTSVNHALNGWALRCQQESAGIPPELVDEIVSFLDAKRETFALALALRRALAFDVILLRIVSATNL